LELDPNYAPAFERLADLLGDRRQFDRALEAFDRYPAYKEFPLSTAKRYATTLIDNGRYADAWQVFESLYPSISGQLPWAEGFGLKMLAAGQDAIAGQVATLVARLGASNSDALVAASRLFADLKQAEPALSLADSALKFEDALTRAQAARARALYLAGRKQEALDLFEATLLKDNQDIDVNRYYAWALATEKKDLPKAGNMAREAIYGSGSDLEVWMTLCYCYLQEQRFDLCRGEANRALSVHSQQSAPHYYLGVAQYHEGKPEAKASLRKAIELGLTGDRLREAQSLLSRL
jgi:Flp pilus assembly protein TadD